MKPPARSDHFDGRRFHNPGHHEDRNWFDVLRWKTRAQPGPWPAWIDLPPCAPPPAPARGVSATWIGHSTFLLRTPTLTFLTDPVWSVRAGPFGLVGPKRVHAPAIALEALPPIDAVLLSHDHYDHCDLVTLRRLSARAGGERTRFITPLGNASLARRAGFAEERITELDWWESCELAPGVRVTATPARHWSNRVRGARNERLWAGFSLATPDARLHFTGDTAADPAMFNAIRENVGAPDLALIPIGGYAPRWFMKEQHCDPAEAVAIHRQLGARRSVGMHWGTFRLTDEGREAPPRELADALAGAGLPPESFVAVAPGTTVEARRDA